ncbi:MAG: hypothetical protein KKF89_01430 [Nanoarchaeota archaeon]|nr:hypothetical protein [Nanoarchaeota archaeon]MBU1854358.1 hypothetical protein [Nanoarchaeota archaeon]
MNLIHPKLLLKYTLEGINNISTWNVYLKNIVLQKADDSVREYLLKRNTQTSVGLLGIIGKIFYDLNGGKNSVIRNQVGLKSSHILFGFRVVDDPIDNPNTSKADKLQILEGYRNIFDGKSSDYFSYDKEVSSAFFITETLRDNFKRDEYLSFIANRVVDLSIKKISYKNKDDLLENTKELCGLTTLSLAQSIALEGESLKDEVAYASYKFGCAGGCLDDMIDLAQNFKEKTNTYPLQRLRELHSVSYGSIIKSGLGKEMLGIIKDELDQGFRGLKNDAELFETLTLMLYLTAAIDYTKQSLIHS